MEERLENNSHQTTPTNGLPEEKQEAAAKGSRRESMALKLLGLLAICVLVTGEVFCIGTLAMGSWFPLRNGESVLATRIVYWGHAYAVPLVFAAIIGWALIIALVIFELLAAGRSRDGQVTIYWIDRIPFDLFTFIALTLIPPCFVTGFEEGIAPLASLDNIDTVFWLMAAFSDVTAILIAIYFLSLARRVKAHVFLENNIIFWICHAVKKFFLFLGTLIPDFWKRMLALLVFSFFELVLLIAYVDATYYYGGAAFAWLAFLLFFAAVALVLWSFWMQKQCFEEAQAIRSGDLSKKIPEEKLKHMAGSLKAHAEDLNSIRDGVEDAVNVRLKSEHLKTELITNVSHDIKTPLTSIISYVDLLGKEHTPEEEKQYIEVLKRQTERLRKLTEDVLEASKADSGNVEVHVEKTSAAEIVEQAVAEYEEKLKKANLETVVNVPDDLYVTADGKLLWRVLRNLLSNATKYSAPGSRVYITGTGEGPAAGSAPAAGNARAAGAASAGAENGTGTGGSSTGGRVTIEIKNVSKDMLNVSADELMERFIRGDASRHTEGSGLGLDIARSLTTLMGGAFDIEIDGDLFKAMVTLPEWKKD